MTGFLLVGGRGSRLGGHKATRLYKGLPLFSYGLGLLQRHAEWTVLLGACDELGQVPLAQWREDCPGEGPLAALVRGLSHSPSAWNLVLALDYPELSDGLLQSLAQARQPDDAAVLPAVGEQRHPLCGYYHRRTAAELRSRFLAGERSVQRALQGLAVRWINVENAELLHNVNRETDLR